MVNVNGLAALLTGIEVVVLVDWLRLTTTAAAVVAVGFLVVGILIEELVRFRGIKGQFPQPRELGLVVGGVVVEAVAWILPLVMDTPGWLTFVILFVGLDVEHAIINLATTGTFSLRRVADFTAVEAVGGAIWLTAPSAITVVILVVASVLEHVQGVRQGLRLRN